MVFDQPIKRPMPRPATTAMMKPSVVV